MKRVLIAEDDAGVRELMAALLAESGIASVEATDGLDAIHKLRDEEYDLVIVDLMMPRIDGYVLIRYLEEQRPGTQAIVISGVRASELESVGQSTSVAAVLAKPLDAAALREAVTSALGPR